MWKLQLQTALLLLCFSLAACSGSNDSSPSAPPRRADPVAPLAALLGRHALAAPGTTAIYIYHADDPEDLESPYLDSAACTSSDQGLTALIADWDGELFGEYRRLRVLFAPADSGTVYMVGFVSRGPDTSDLQLSYKYGDEGIYNSLWAHHTTANSIRGILRITHYDRVRNTISGMFASDMSTGRLLGFAMRITVSGSFTEVPIS